MKFDSLIRILEKQLKLYTSLYEIAISKVDVIKGNDISTLNQMMNNEQKHITAITALENERIKELQQLFQTSSGSQPTMSECIEKADIEQKLILEDLYKNLTDLLQKIKDQNELNQELIQQSLQFVNYSLDLFQPRTKSINYGPPSGNKKATPIGSRSIFNSQA